MKIKNPSIKKSISIVFIMLGIIILSLVYNYVEAKIVNVGGYVVKHSGSGNRIMAYSFENSYQKSGGKVFLSCAELLDMRATYYTLLCDGHGQRLTSNHTHDSDYSTGLPIHSFDVTIGGKTYTVKNLDGSDIPLWLLNPSRANGKTILKTKNSGKGAKVEWKDEDDDHSESESKTEFIKKLKKAGKAFDSIQHITYGEYSASMRTATPEQAFILQYITQNTSRFSPVQLAWWGIGGSGASGSTGVLTPGTYDTTTGNLDNIYYTGTATDGGLEGKARAFGQYIRMAYNGLQPDKSFVANTGTIPVAGNGFFNIDYKKCVDEFDTSSVDVLYDSTTNSYRVGPLSIHYLRYAYDEEWDFAGISNAAVTVQYADGETRIMELKPNTDCSIVYDCKRNMVSPDTEATYPYPYSGEKFYIQIKYKENMTYVKELKFNFHWMNGQGQYELLTGSAYIVSYELGPISEDNLDSTEGTKTVSGDDDDYEEHDYWDWDGYIYGKVKSVSATETQQLANGIKGETRTIDPFKKYRRRDIVIPGIPGDEEDEPGTPGWEENYEGPPGVITEEIPDSQMSPGGAPNLQGVSVTTGGWDLTIDMGGFAWSEKILNGKGKITGDGNSKYGTGDILLGNEDNNSGRIEVRVYKVLYNYTNSSNKYTEVSRQKAKVYKTKRTSNGVTFANRYDFSSSKLYTNETTGKYQFYCTIPSTQTKKPAQRVGYDIEFIYNGQKYEAVKYLVSAGEGLKVKKSVDALQDATRNITSRGQAISYKKFKDDSYVVEDETERAKFDKKFLEVYGDSTTKINKSDLSSLGYSKGGTNVVKLKYNGKNPKGRVESKLSLQNSAGHLEDEGGIMYSEFQMKARTSTAAKDGFALPYFPRIYIRHYTDKVADDKLTKATQLVPNEGRILDGGRTVYLPIYELFHQINLGLVKRTEVDLSVSKDLYKAAIVANQQELTYKFSVLRDYEMEENEEYLDVLLEMQKLDVRYELGLYPSDFYYRSNFYKDGSVVGNKIQNWKKDSELRLFATYKISVYNDSDTDYATVNELADYYDSAFTMVRQEVKADVLNNEGEKYKKVVAEVPYYRIYSLYEASLAESQYLYNYNSEQDRSVGLARVRGTRPVDTGELNPNVWVDEASGSTDYKKSILKDRFKYQLGGDGTIDPDDSVVLSPGERLELFITYEVDKEGYEASKTQTIDTAKNQLKATRDKLLGGKNNVAEIVNFSSFYAEGTNKDGNIHGVRFVTSAYKANQPSGKVDEDSAPSNVNLDITQTKSDPVEGSSTPVTYKTLDKRYFDDDTDSAPIFKIYLRDKGEYARKINGVVWEDEDARDEKGTDSSTGNGKYDPSEKGIKDITASLVEKIRIKEGGNWLEYEFTWPDKINLIMEDYNPVTTTGADGSYEFVNFVAGIYVVRFDYGNKVANIKYNGQDYENTAYQTGIKNQGSDGSYELALEDWHNHDNENLMGKETLNNEWHDLEAKKLNKDRVSDARDYEPRRLRVIAYSRTIANSNAEILSTPDREDGVMTDEAKQLLIDATSMEANTAKLNFEAEKQTEIDYTKFNEFIDFVKNSTNTAPAPVKALKVVKGITRSEKIAAIKNKTIDVLEPSETQKYSADNIDFGLEKRAYTSLQLDKHLKQIILSKEHGGEIILNAIIKDDSRIDYEHKDAVNNNKILSLETSEGVQGFHYIQMESSYFKDLTVDLKYRIDVINESEADWTSKWASERYTAKELIKKAEELEGDYESKITPLRTGEGITYGEVAGYYYYTNKAIDKDPYEKAFRNPRVGESSPVKVKYEDRIVKTTVDQLAEYIDKDITIAESSKNGAENNSWTNDFNSIDSSGDKTKQYTDGIIYNARGLLSQGKYRNDKSDNSYSEISGKKYLTVTGNEPLVAEKIGNFAVTVTDTIKREDELKLKILKRKPNGIKMPTTSGKVWYQEQEKPVIEHVYGYEYKESGDIKHENVFNKELTKELEPFTYADVISGDKKKCVGRVEIDTSITVKDASTMDNMNYANLSEILEYSNAVGRRAFMANSIAPQDTSKDFTKFDDDIANKKLSVENNGEKITADNIILSEIKTINKTTGNDPVVLPVVPGNALEMAKYIVANHESTSEAMTFWKTGHASNQARHIGDRFAEIDTDATDYVTFTEPQGLPIKAARLRMLVKVIVGVIIILIVCIIGMTGKVVYNKKKKSI